MMRGEGNDLALRLLVAEALTLRLFRNDADGSDSIQEATFHGYTPVSLDGSGWTFISEAYAGYPPQSFMSTSTQNRQRIFGMYLTHDPSGRIVCAERFSDGPYEVRNNGDRIDATARIRFGAKQK